MGCNASVFKSCSSFGGNKVKRTNNTDDNGNDTVEGNGAGEDKKSKQKLKKQEKKSSNKKSAKNSKKSSENKKTSNGESKTNGSNKTGSAISTAKVRPMTPTLAPQNIPKPVAFEINLDKQQNKEQEKNDNEINSTIPSELGHNVDNKDGVNVLNNGDSTAELVSNDIDVAPQNGDEVVTDGVDISKPQIKFPRRLPKLSSLRGRNSVEIKTNEEIISKQKKAEEKRLQILEGKKKKARKFVEKFSTNNNKAINGDRSMSQESNEELIENSDANQIDDSSQQNDNTESKPIPTIVADESV